MSVIVSVNHETGDLSQYTSTSGTGLSASALAALAGTSYGLACAISDTTNRYGQHLLGSADTSGVVRCRFYLDPNGLTMANADIFNPVVLLNGSAAFLFNFSLNWNGSTYRVRVTVNGDVTDPYTSLAVITDEPHYFEILLVRATTNVSSDGYCTLWIDGALIETLSAIDNYDSFNGYRYARVGAVSGLDAGTSGTLYLDELVVNNDGSEIGPAATPKSVADSGAGSDALPLLSAALVLAESGSGAETSLPAARLPLADAGAGADLLAQLLTGLPLADLGSGSDALARLAADLPLTDSGAASDAIAGLAALLQLPDTGAGGDALDALDVTLSLSDAGAGVDAVMAFVFVLKAVADLAAGADRVGQIAVDVPLSDSGAGAELARLAALVRLADLGAGVEVTVRRPAPRIARLLFILRARQAAFSLAVPSMAFSLSARSASFSLAAG